MDTKRKLKFTEKLAYGLADFPEAANSILAAFLTMFYTDNIGMAAGAVGTMFFVSKLFDGITDILAGTLIDKTKTRWGKARPWLLWLSVPTGLALALIFFIPSNGSATTKMIYAFVTYNLFTAVMFTITGIARSALLALMTQDNRERGGMAAFGMFFGLGGTILGCSFTFPLVFKLGGDVMAWRILFLIYGAIVAAGLLAGFFLSKEYVTSVESVTQTETKKISFAEGLKLFFTNKYLIFALVMTVLVNFVTQVNSCSQTYFYTYTMGDAMLTTTLNLVSIVPILVGIVVLVGPCLGKFGKRNCMYIGIAGQLIGSIIRGIAGMTQNVPLLIAGTIISGAVTGLLAVPVSTLFADGIDYGEYKTNRRIEGTGSAITSFSQKISSGLALASVGWVLALTGYVQNQVSEATNMGIITLYAWLPAILLAIIFALLKLCYHYDKEEPTVIAELERRKKEATK
ncbi:MAG: glycoside-pentoside-hexuronide (GPH):cation symporter [Lachnospiraceae bacterium]|jgi:GPH family glycoside/pentoside/hexuronide:cation symporter|nr:glycoside-pentoside-hexuronide (GPH):cation symporter [Lachnospiraceae bacterium]MDD3616725.1 glycoside-pentoside-hexuronide (GPH):cation symporter [Lachnospiraceae bacterium]